MKVPQRYRTGHSSIKADVHFKTPNSTHQPAKSYASATSSTIKPNYKSMPNHEHVNQPKNLVRANPNIRTNNQGIQPQIHSCNSNPILNTHSNNQGSQPQFHGCDVDPNTCTNNHGNQPQFYGRDVNLNSQSNNQGNQPQFHGCDVNPNTRTNNQGSQPQSHGRDVKLPIIPKTQDIRANIKSIKLNVQNEPIIGTKSKNENCAKSKEIPNNSTTTIYEITCDPLKKSLPHITTKTSVSNKPLSFLIDTGSSISLIKRSSMQSCPSLDKTILRLKGVDNNTDTFSTLGKFKLNISLPEENLYFPFHVVEKIHLSYDGIIGNDMLNNYHGKIDYNKNELDLNKNIIKLKFSEPTYNIAARTEAVIECTVENPEIKEGMITDQRVSESLLIANCIVKVRDNNRVIISIANISEEPVTINSNLNLRILPLESSSSISLDTNPNSINSCLHRTNKVLDLLRTSHLNQEESVRLFDLCSNFSDIFHIPDEKLSHTQTLEHQIVTTSPYPIHVKSYRFPEIHKK